MPRRHRRSAGQQADAVVALEVGGIRQNQIGVGHHLRGKGVGIDDVRDAVFAVVILVGKATASSAVFIDEFQLYVRHEHQQRVDAVRIAGHALRMTLCIRPCALSG